MPIHTREARELNRVRVELNRIETFFFIHSQLKSLE